MGGGVGAKLKGQKKITGRYEATWNFQEGGGGGCRGLMVEKIPSLEGVVIIECSTK